MAISYRFLDPTEFHLIEPYFIEQEADLPNLALSTVYGAFTDSNELVGFHVLQLVPHAEPMMIHPDYRAKVSWKEFQKGIESLFDKEAGGSYYIFPSDERIAKLCKRGGMKECELKAYRRDL